MWDCWCTALAYWQELNGPPQSSGCKLHQRTSDMPAGRLCDLSPPGNSLDHATLAGMCRVLSCLATATVTCAAVP